MKKMIIGILTVFLTVFCIYFIGSGFRKETSVDVSGYSLNEDAACVTVHAGVSGSAGYLRKALIHETEDGEITVSFLSAFGGVNGNIGASSAFEIPFHPYSRTISLDCGDYERLILFKDTETGEWKPADGIRK